MKFYKLYYFITLLSFTNFAGSQAVTVEKYSDLPLDRETRATDLGSNMTL